MNTLDLLRQRKTGQPIGAEPMNTLDLLRQRKGASQPAAITPPVRPAAQDARLRAAPTVAPPVRPASRPAAPTEPGIGGRIAATGELLGRSIMDPISRAAFGVTRTVGLRSEEDYARREEEAGARVGELERTAYAPTVTEVAGGALGTAATFIPAVKGAQILTKAAQLGKLAPWMARVSGSALAGRAAGVAKGAVEFGLAEAGLRGLEEQSGEAALEGLEHGAKLGTFMGLAHPIFATGAGKAFANALKKKGFTAGMIDRAANGLADATVFGGDAAVQQAFGEMSEEEGRDFAEIATSPELWTGVLTGAAFGAFGGRNFVGRNRATGAAMRGAANENPRVQERANRRYETAAGERTAADIERQAEKTLPFDRNLLDENMERGRRPMLPETPIEARYRAMSDAELGDRFAGREPRTAEESSARIDALRVDEARTFGEWDRLDAEIRDAETTPDRKGVAERELADVRTRHTAILDEIELYRESMRRSQVGREAGREYRRATAGTTREEIERRGPVGPIEPERQLALPAGRREEIGQRMPDRNVRPPEPIEGLVPAEEAGRLYDEAAAGRTAREPSLAETMTFAAEGRRHAEAERQRVGVGPAYDAGRADDVGRRDAAPAGGDARRGRGPAVGQGTEAKKEPWEMTQEEYHRGRYLHGTAATFDQFKIQRGRGHGVIYVNEPARKGRQSQAEAIAEGPFGGRLVVAEADLSELKRFDPRRDQRSREILEELGIDPRGFYKNDNVKEYVEYPDMGDIAPKAIAEGYELFKVREPADTGGTGFSYAIARADALRILPSHRDIVSTALREGRPVPDNVLADYPDLAPKRTTEDIRPTLPPIERPREPERVPSPVRPPVTPIPPPPVPPKPVPVREPVVESSRAEMPAPGRFDSATMARLRDNGYNDPVIALMEPGQLPVILGDKEPKIWEYTNELRTMKDQQYLVQHTPDRLEWMLNQTMEKQRAAKDGRGEDALADLLADEEKIRTVIEATKASKKITDVRVAEALAKRKSQASAPKAKTAPPARPVREPYVGPRAVGKEGIAYTEEDRTPVPYRYEVVEAEGNVASHDYDGNANPVYPAEYQPRDRSRVASRAWIEEKARKVNPALLADNPKASDGAPMVDADGNVISGNGRVLFLNRAYENGTAGEYRQYLVENAERLGLDRAAIEGMARPVLRRVLTGEVDLRKLGIEANVSGQARMTATEQAKVDARLVDGAMLELIVPNASGDFNSAANRDFVRAFVGKVPESERGNLMMPDGSLNQDGVRRVRNAVLGRIYGDDRLIAEIAESADPDIRAVGNALAQSAPAFARLRAKVDGGTLPREADPTADVVDAAMRLKDIRQRKITVDDYLAQTDITEGPPPEGVAEILRAFDANKRSAKATAEYLLTLVEQAEYTSPTGQGGLFEETGPVSSADIARRALERTRAGKGRQVEETTVNGIVAPGTVTGRSAGPTEPRVGFGPRGRVMTAAGVTFDAARILQREGRGERIDRGELDVAAQNNGIADADGMTDGEIVAALRQRVKNPGALNPSFMTEKDAARLVGVSEKLVGQAGKGRMVRRVPFLDKLATKYGIDTEGKTPGEVVAALARVPVAGSTGTNPAVIAAADRAAAAMAGTPGTWMPSILAEPKAAGPDRYWNPITAALWRIPFMRKVIQDFAAITEPPEQAAEFVLDYAERGAGREAVETVRVGRRLKQSFDEAKRIARDMVDELHRGIPEESRRQVDLILREIKEIVPADETGRPFVERIVWGTERRGRATTGAEGIDLPVTSRAVMSKENLQAINRRADEAQRVYNDYLDRIARRRGIDITNRASVDWDSVPETTAEISRAEKLRNQVDGVWNEYYRAIDTRGIPTNVREFDYTIETAIDPEGNVVAKRWLEDVLARSNPDEAARIIGYLEYRGGVATDDPVVRAIQAALRKAGIREDAIERVIFGTARRDLWAKEAAPRIREEKIRVAEEELAKAEKARDAHLETIAKRRKVDLGAMEEGGELRATETEFARLEGLDAVVETARAKVDQAKAWDVREGYVHDMPIDVGNGYIGIMRRAWLFRKTEGASQLNKREGSLESAGLIETDALKTTREVVDGGIREAWKVASDDLYRAMAAQAGKLGLSEDATRSVKLSDGTEVRVSKALAAEMEPLMGLDPASAEHDNVFAELFRRWTSDVALMHLASPKSIIRNWRGAKVMAAHMPLEAALKGRFREVGDYFDARGKAFFGTPSAETVRRFSAATHDGDLGGAIAAFGDIWRESRGSRLKKSVAPEVLGESVIHDVFRGETGIRSWVGTLIEAGDRSEKRVVYYARMKGEARRIARGEKLKGKALDFRMRQLMATPTKGMRDKGFEAVMTYAPSYGEAPAWLTKFGRTALGPGIAPYLKWRYFHGRMIGRYEPIRNLIGMTNATVAGDKDGFFDAFARFGVGMMIIGSGYYIAKKSEEARLSVEGEGEIAGSSDLAPGVPLPEGKRYLDTSGRIRANWMAELMNGFAAEIGVDQPFAEGKDWYWLWGSDVPVWGLTVPAMAQVASAVGIGGLERDRDMDLGQIAKEFATRGPISDLMNILTESTDQYSEGMPMSARLGQFVAQNAPGLTGYATLLNPVRKAIEKTKRRSYDPDAGDARNAWYGFASQMPVLSYWNPKVMSTATGEPVPYDIGREILMEGPGFNLRGIDRAEKQNELRKELYRTGKRLGQDTPAGQAERRALAAVSGETTRRQGALTMNERRRLAAEYRAAHPGATAEDVGRFVQSKMGTEIYEQVENDPSVAGLGSARAEIRSRADEGDVEGIQEYAAGIGPESATVGEVRLRVTQAFVSGGMAAAQRAAVGTGPGKYPSWGKAVAALWPAEMRGRTFVPSYKVFSADMTRAKKDAREEDARLRGAPSPAMERSDSRARDRTRRRAELVR